MRFIPAEGDILAIEFVNPALLTHTRVLPDMTEDGPTGQFSVYGFIGEDVVRIASRMTIERATEVAANPETAGG